MISKDLKEGREMKNLLKTSLTIAITFFLTQAACLAQDDGDVPAMPTEGNEEVLIEPCNTDFEIYVLDEMALMNELEQQDIEAIVKRSNLLTNIETARDAMVQAFSDMEMAQSNVDQLETDIVLQNGVVSDWIDIVSARTAALDPLSDDFEQKRIELEDANLRLSEEVEILQNLQSSRSAAEQARDDAEDAYSASRNTLDAAIQDMLAFDPDFDASQYGLS